MMTYFQFFADHEAFLEPLDDAERGRLLTALIAYAFRGEEPALTGNERYVWPIFRRMLDQSISKLEQRKAAGAKNAERTVNDAASHEIEASTKGNETKRTSNETERTVNEVERTPNETRQESRIKNQESGNRNQESGDRKQNGGEGAKRTRFSPPTPEEVDAYAREHGLKVDAHRFCDFYASKGWKVGSSPMKDWRAAVRNWASRDAPGVSPGNSPPSKVVGEQKYAQRTYSNDLSALDRMMAAWQDKTSPEEVGA